MLLFGQNGTLPCVMGRGIAESKTFSNLETDSSILTNSLFNFLILFLCWDFNFCAPSILFIMESLGGGG